MKNPNDTNKQANIDSKAAKNKSQNTSTKESSTNKANANANPKNVSNQANQAQARNNVSTGRKTPQKYNAKGQVISNEELVVKPPPPKEKNLERYIHITTYKDHESIAILKDLFETTNKQAFDLKSAKEIYTRDLTDEEKEDNSLDYISGFQLIDSNTRITILEGISEKSMKIVKEKLQKNCLNNNLLKIFSNSKFLYDTRLYNKFGLCLKLIKLRNPLNEILQTYDIYSKANKYRDIYNAFMNLGFITKSSTFQEISDANLFPVAESLLMLERKYADILNNEDISGIYSKQKSSKRIAAIGKEKFGISGESLNTSTNNSDGNGLNDSRLLTSSKVRSRSKVNRTVKKNHTHPVDEKFKTSDETPKSKKKEKKHEKIDTRNYEFVNFKKNSEMNKPNSHQRNLDLLKNLNSKANTNKFCKIIEESDGKFNLDKDAEFNKNESSVDLSINHSQSSFIKNNVVILPKKEEIYFYSNLKNNYYIEYVNKLREECINDKNSFYTYSMDYLGLSFPMIEDSNKEYESYLKNKKVTVYLKLNKF